MTKTVLKVSSFGNVFLVSSISSKKTNEKKSTWGQRYTYRVLQTIQMKLILLWVWAERAVLGSTKTALKLKYKIQIIGASR